jgi:glycosyltransferase involved in cell wall biosynthesis
VVIISFQDPRSIQGGVQRRVAEEVAYLDRLDVQVTVISEGISDLVSDGNVTYVTIPAPHMIYPVRLLCFAERVARFLEGLRNVDVLELHDDAVAVFLFAGRHGWETSRVCVSIAHGVFRDEFSAIYRSEGLSGSTLRAGGYWLLSFIEQLTVHRADAIIAVSQYVANEYARQYRIPRERIRVVSNGIDTRVFMPAHHSSDELGAGSKHNLCTLLYVGRLHPRKGVLQLLHAYSLAIRSNPAIRLRIVGNGIQADALHSESKKLGLLNLVEFAGLLSTTELVEAYRCADIVCIPSLQEGQGIVALEAQACGKPVIATQTGGLTEIVRDRLTGILVPPGDTQALAGAILELAGNSTLRRVLGSNAAEWAQAFAWENVLSEAVDLYDALLNVALS